jgi:CheY-like chemotaxis protein
MRILVLDDDEDILEVPGMVLQAEGHPVELSIRMTSTKWRRNGK